MEKILSGLSVVLAITLVGALDYTTNISKLTSSSELKSTPAPVATTVTTTVAKIDSSKTLEVNRIPAERITLPQQTRIVGTAVSISANSGFGCGAVLSENMLVTVAHVIGEQQIVLVDVGRYKRTWKPARVVGKLSASGEAIIVLQLMDGAKFDNIANFNVGTGFKMPRWMVTPRGVYDFNPGIIVPGDSGGAILNIDGELIGLVTGYVTHNRAGVITLFE